MPRPRQCVPLACVKFIRRRPSADHATTTDSCRDSLSELQRLVAARTSAYRVHSIQLVPQPQPGPNLPCSSSTSVTSTSHSTVLSHQSNAVQQSPLLNTLLSAATQQRSQCPPVDTAVTPSPTVGLASAVWRPMGAVLQPTPQNRAPPADCAEKIRLLAVHNRLTVMFNEEFAGQMNAIIHVMHEARRDVTSAVFQYTFERLRMLRTKYCDFAQICVAYDEYQTKVRSSQNIALPTISCLQSSIQLMMDSVNTVTTIFRGMRQWLSADTRMTVVERGLVLSNKLCHFVPVFMQEMDNFKRSLLMIVPPLSTTHLPSSASSVSEFSAATVETLGSSSSSPILPLLSGFPLNENSELYGQDVEQNIVGAMPIVIEPDGKPYDEFDLTCVKQEPSEVNRRRPREHAELVYVIDDDDDAAASAVVGDDSVSRLSNDGSSTQHCNEVSEEAVGDNLNRASEFINSAQADSVDVSASAVRSLVTVAGGNVCHAGHLSSDISGPSDTVGVSANIQLTSGPTTISCDDDWPTSTTSIRNVSVTDTISTATAETNVFQGSTETFESRGEIEHDVRSTSRSLALNDSDMGSMQHTSDCTASTASDHCSRTITLDCQILNVTSGGGALHDSGYIPCRQTVDVAAVSYKHEPRAGQLSNAANDSNSVTEPGRSNTSSNLCTIASVCSVDPQGFDGDSAGEGMTIDDIVSAVRAFDENASIVFHNVDLLPSCVHPQTPEVSDSVPVKVVARKRKRVPASRFARRKKQRGKAALRKSFVSGNSEAVEDVHEDDISDSMLHPEHGEKSDDSSAVINVPVDSDKHRSENTEAACDDASIEGTLLDEATDIFSNELDAGLETGRRSETVNDDLSFRHPLMEKMIPESGMIESTDSLSEEHQSEASVAVNSKTEFDVIGVGSNCEEAAGLGSGMQYSEERQPVDVVEEKSNQHESEDSDDLVIDVDEDILNTPGKRKRARVLCDDDDDESVTGVSVNGRSLKRKTRTSVRADDGKKVQKFRSAKSVSRKLKLSVILEEKPSKKKTKPQEQKRQTKGSSAKHVTVESEQLSTDSQHNHTALGKHKLEKSKKLIKRGIKQKKISLRSENKNVILDSDGVTVNRDPPQTVSCRLTMSPTVDVGVKEVASAESCNITTDTLSASIAHSRDNEDQSRLSARDKINAIYRNSEFTRLQGTTSLVHAKRKNPLLSPVAASPSKATVDHSKIDAKSTIFPLWRTSERSSDGCGRDVLKSVVTSSCLTGTAVTSSAVSSSCRSVMRRPLVREYCSASDLSVKHKVLGNQSSTVRSGPANQVSQRKSCEVSSSSLPVVSSDARVHSVQNTVPKSKPFFQKTTTDVSSISQRITGSQSMCRDPRLAQKQHSVTTEKWPSFGFSEHRSKENLSADAVKAQGSMQWPWEQVPPWSEQDPRKNERRTAAGLVSESGKKTDLSSSSCSAPNIRVDDILSDLSTTSSSAEYLQNVVHSSQWHSARRVVHSGSIISPPLPESRGASSSWSACSRQSVGGRKVEDRRSVKEVPTARQLGKLTVSVASHSARTVSQSEAARGIEMTALNDILSPVSDVSSVGVADINVMSQNLATVSDSPLPLDRDDGWRLILLDLPPAKPPCERKSRSSPWSVDPDLLPIVVCWETESTFDVLLDPRPKSTDQAFHGSNLSHKSHICGSVTRGTNDVDSLPVVVPWDTESDWYDARSDPRLKTRGLVFNTSLQPDEPEMSEIDRGEDVDLYDSILSGVEQTEPAVELTKTLPAVDSLDNFDTFVSKLDSFPVNKNVEDVVDQMMSWWEADLDDTEQRLDNLSDPGDLPAEFVEGNDSDVDQFIIIDDDDDDDSSDELVIDLTSSDIELKSETGLNHCLDNSHPLTSLASGRTTEHDVAQNTEKSIAAASRTDHSKTKQFSAEAEQNSHVDNPADHRRENRLSTGDEPYVAGHWSKSAKHVKGASERVKRGSAEGDASTVAQKSSGQCNTNTSQQAAETAAVTSHNRDMLRRNCDNSPKVIENSCSAAVSEVDNSGGKVPVSRSSRNTRKVPASKNIAKDSGTTTASNKDPVVSRCKSSKASSRDSDSATTVSVSSCVASLAELSNSDLGSLEDSLEAQLQSVEQKGKICEQYACPLDNLTESEKRQLVCDRLAEPGVIKEFSTELRLQSLQTEIDRTRELMARVSSRFDPKCPSKYEQHERVCEDLLVRRDWSYVQMNRMQRYHKSKCLLTVPDDLRFSWECGEFVSVEGVPLVLKDFTISLQHCKRLAALLSLIKSIRHNPVRLSSHAAVHKLGWLHRERRRLMKVICCSSPDKVNRGVKCLSEKLAVYKYVTFTLRRKHLLVRCDC